MALPEDDPPPGVPEWVVTYGDMMSLLLTFFIMLVSMAEMKQDARLRAMLDSMKQQFGPTAGAFGVPGPSIQGTSMHPFASSQGNSSLGGTGRGGREAIGRGGPGEGVKSIAEGSELTLGAPVPFEPTSVTIGPELQEDLQRLAKLVLSRPNDIAVRGHAITEFDGHGDPIDVYKTSHLRALAVVDALAKLGVSRESMVVSVAGDHEPRVISRDPSIRRQNHRVDVFVQDTYTSKQGTPTSSNAAP